MALIQPITTNMADLKKTIFKRIIPGNLSTYFDWREAKGEKDKFVRFGDDNRFPEQTIDLYNKSSIHAAAVNAITEAVIGLGLTADDESVLEYANTAGETWNDIYSKVALDYKLHGSFSLEVIWSNDRSRLDVYHIDFSHIRAKEKDSRGMIPGYYVSSDWNKIGTYRESVTNEEALYLPVYNPLKKDEEAHQIFVHRNYRPGQSYYPLPDYVGAYRVIELDTEIDNFHTNNIKNGLAPSLSITTFTNGSDDQLKDIQLQLNSNYGGSENAGSLMFMDVASKEEAPIITPIPNNSNDTYYTTINDMVSQKILTAHRITSPMILGIKTSGQLGGRAEVIDAYLLFQNTVVTPYQQDILSSLELLIDNNYPDTVLGVEQRKLYSDGDEDTEIVTDTDTTAQEDADIQQEESAPILA